MKANVNNPYVETFYDVDGSLAKNTFTVAAGAAGFVDTDISGSDVPQGATKIQLLIAPAASGDAWAASSGLGSGLIPTVTHQLTVVIRNINLRADLYRAAAQDNIYRIYGYDI